MANLSLADIPTKETLTKKDIFNMEVIHGKFNLSYRSSLSSFSSFFLSSDELTKMTNQLDNYCVWLDHRVRDGANDSLMDKEEMENKFLFLSEAKYYYKRLLTDEVMENVCSEYTKINYLSSVIDNCREYGQSRATALANALAQDAAMVKSKAIMNDTNIQLESLKIDAMGTVAEIISTSAGGTEE